MIKIKVIRLNQLLYYMVVAVLAVVVLLLLLRLVILKSDGAIPDEPVVAAFAMSDNEPAYIEDTQSSNNIYLMTFKKALPIICGQGARYAASSLTDIGTLLRNMITIDMGQPDSLLSTQIPLLSGIPKAIPVSSRGTTRVTPGTEKIEDENGDIILHNSDDEVNIDISDITDDLENVQLAGNGPQILIYHSHATEAYKPSPGYDYNPSGNSRTTDTNFNMVRVGKQLAYYLEQDYHIDVYHDTTLHDYPSYNDSYANSLASLKKDMETYPTLKMFFDIHRDAYSDSSGNGADDSISINGKPTARIMMVIGTGQGFKDKPNYKENYKLALKLKEELDKIAPGISKGIMVKTGRYNQHVSTNAVLIEVGSDHNTLDEALEATKYLSQAIANTVKK